MAGAEKDDLYEAVQAVRETLHIVGVHSTFTVQGQMILRGCSSDFLEDWKMKRAKSLIPASFSVSAVRLYDAQRNRALPGHDGGAGNQAQAFNGGLRRCGAKQTASRGRTGQTPNDFGL